MHAFNNTKGGCQRVQRGQRWGVLGVWLGVEGWAEWEGASLAVVPEVRSRIIRLHPPSLRPDRNHVIELDAETLDMPATMPATLSERDEALRLSILGFLQSFRIRSLKQAS